MPSLGSVDTETGILYHKIMELIDFGDCSLDGVKTQLGAMARAGVDVSGADAAKIMPAARRSVVSFFILVIPLKKVVCNTVWKIPLFP